MFSGRCSSAFRVTSSRAPPGSWESILKPGLFSVLSHLGTMHFVQLAHALSLHDVCDWLRLKA